MQSLSHAAHAECLDLVPWGNEALRHQWNYGDDPYRSRWECMHSPETASAVAFDYRGNFLAIGTSAGEVRRKTPYQDADCSEIAATFSETQNLDSPAHPRLSRRHQIVIWDVTAIRQVVARLVPPDDLRLELRSRNSLVTSQEVASIGWSANSRLLLTISSSGSLLTVWDVSSCTVLSVLKAPAGARLRFVKVHPIDYRLILAVPWFGMPYLIDWTSAECWQIPESVLPPPKSRSSSGRGESNRSSRVGAAAPPGRALRTDAVFHSRHGRTLYVFTSRSDVVKLRLGLLEARLATSTSVLEAQLSGGGTVAPSGSHHSVAAAAVARDHVASAPLSRGVNVHNLVYRLAYSYTATALVPPEIHHSRHHGFVMITTTKSGLVRHEDEELAQIDKGYCEPVDQTPLVSARLSFKDRAILALPSNDKAGHSCGGVYAFRVGAVGDLKLKAGPPSGVAAFDVHPKLGFIVGLSFRGQVWSLQQALLTSFPGAMFPPGFQLMSGNREYLEREDELDLIDESGVLLPRPERRFPIGGLVDALLSSGNSSSAVIAAATASSLSAVSNASTATDSSNEMSVEAAAITGETSSSESGSAAPPLKTSPSFSASSCPAEDVVIDLVGSKPYVTDGDHGSSSGSGGGSDDPTAGTWKDDGGELLASLPYIPAEAFAAIAVPTGVSPSVEAAVGTVAAAATGELSTSKSDAAAAAAAPDVTVSSTVTPVAPAIAIDERILSGPIAVDLTLCGRLERWERVDPRSLHTGRVDSSSSSSNGGTSSSPPAALTAAAARSACPSDADASGIRAWTTAAPFSVPATDDASSTARSSRAPRVSQPPSARPVPGLDSTSLLLGTTEAALLGVRQSQAAPLLIDIESSPLLGLRYGLPSLLKAQAAAVATSQHAFLPYYRWSSSAAPAAAAAAGGDGGTTNFLSGDGGGGPHSRDFLEFSSGALPSAPLSSSSAAGASSSNALHHNLGAAPSSPAFSAVSVSAAHLFSPSAPLRTIPLAAIVEPPERVVVVAYESQLRDFARAMRDAVAAADEEASAEESLTGVAARRDAVLAGLNVVEGEITRRAAACDAEAAALARAATAGSSSKRHASSSSSSSAASANRPAAVGPAVQQKRGTGGAWHPGLAIGGSSSSASLGLSSGSGSTPNLPPGVTHPVIAGGGGVMSNRPPSALPSSSKRAAQPSMTVGADGSMHPPSQPKRMRGPNKPKVVLLAPQVTLMGAPHVPTHGAAVNNISSDAPVQHVHTHGAGSLGASSSSSSSAGRPVPSTSGAAAGAATFMPSTAIRSYPIPGAASRPYPIPSPLFNPLLLARTGGLAPTSTYSRIPPTSSNAMKPAVVSSVFGPAAAVAPASAPTSAAGTTATSAPVPVVQATVQAPSMPLVQSIGAPPHGARSS